MKKLIKLSELVYIIKMLLQRSSECKKQTVAISRPEGTHIIEFEKNDNGNW